MYKSDIFVIGLIVLEMATLKPSEKYFNSRTKTIGMHKIKEEINGLISNYSYEFVNFLTKILTENPHERPNLDQLGQIIKILEQSNSVKQSSSIKITETNEVVERRKKALESRRQQLEEEESSQSIFMSAITTHPASTKSIDKFKDTPFRKVSLLPLSQTQSSSRAFSAKLRDASSLKKNEEKVSTFYKNSNFSHFSLLDGPIKIPRRRF